MRGSAASGAIAAISLLLYALLTALVMAGRADALDARLMLALAETRRPWLSPIMHAIGGIGGGGVAIPVALLFVYVLWRGRRTADARAYAIIALGGWALYALAKFSVHRARPHVIPYLYHGAGWYSYPSGHSTLAPVVFGVAAAMWSAPWRSRARRRALMVAAGLLACAIALSRVYIGVHYPSDAVGGLLLGLTWSAFWFWWWGTAEPTAPQAS